MSRTFTRRSVAGMEWRELARSQCRVRWTMSRMPGADDQERLIRRVAHVRRLGPGDEELAHDATLALGETSAGVANAAAWLADPARHLVVATDGDGLPVGWAYAYELPRLKRSGAGLLLYEIDVAETSRRRGIGRAMVEELLRTARSRGIDRMWVLTNASSDAAMKLYAATGATRPHRDDAMWRWDLA
jgi:GNAT superfamily N-acetyltransferase